MNLEVGMQPSTSSGETKAEKKEGKKVGRSERKEGKRLRK